MTARLLSRTRADWTNLHAELVERAHVLAGRIDVEDALEASVSYECFTVASIDYRSIDGHETPSPKPTGDYTPVCYHLPAPSGNYATR